MKTILALVCFSLLLAGCTSAGSHAHPLRDALEDYRSIEKGMTRKEVVALLGQPGKASRTWSLYWKEKYLSQAVTNYVEMTVRYDDDDRVMETDVREGTDRYAGMPGSP